MKKEVRVLMLLIVAALLTCSCGSTEDNKQAPVDRSSTVASFHFNEGTGAITVDSSSTGLTASITGGAAWVIGKSGSALSFNNGTGEATTTNTGSYLDASTFTAEAWLYPEADCANDTCLIIGDAFSWMLRLNNGSVEFWINYGLGSEWAKLATSTAPLATGAWHYIAATFNGNRAVLYIDGVADANSSLIYTIGDDSFHRTISIGGSSGCCSFMDYVKSFPGAIDEVMISKEERSAVEIAAGYNALK